MNEKKVILSVLLLATILLACNAESIQKRSEEQLELERVHEMLYQEYEMINGKQ
jgi:hypothetical protein